MLLAGEIHFFTLMGGILGTLVPPAEVQQVPFAFRSAAQAHPAVDGPLGAHLRGEMTCQGMHGFAVGGFDNGMRQITGVERPILVPADWRASGCACPPASGRRHVQGVRRPDGRINSVGIHEALKSGKVDAQENPLALVELFSSTRS